MKCSYCGSNNTITSTKSISSLLPGRVLIKEPILESYECMDCRRKF